MRPLPLLSLLLAGCATVPVTSGDAPKGSVVERSGFATIRAVEPAPLPVRPTKNIEGGAGRAVMVAEEKRFVRSFPQAPVDPDIILTSGTIGRIQLVDGCFRLGSRPGAPLVLFARATRLGRDADGYLTVFSRTDPESSVRIGEWAIWGGWNEPEEDWPAVIQLRRQCGSGPVINVGQPSSRLIPHDPLEEARRLAAARRTSLDLAWSRLRTCLIALSRRAVHSRQIPQQRCLARS